MGLRHTQGKGQGPGECTYTHIASCGYISSLTKSYVENGSFNVVFIQLGNSCAVIIGLMLHVHCI